MNHYTRWLYVTQPSKPHIFKQDGTWWVIGGSKEYPAYVAMGWVAKQFGRQDISAFCPPFVALSNRVAVAHP